MLTLAYICALSAKLTLTGALSLLIARLHQQLQTRRQRCELHMHGAELRLVLSLLGVLKCCARRRLTLRRGLLLTGTLYGIAVSCT
jgi:hypothetical protein